MLALTVSVAGASYGQDGSLDFVLKDVVVGKYPWLFNSSFSMLSNGEFITNDSKFRKFDATGRLVSSIPSPSPWSRYWLGNNQQYMMDGRVFDSNFNLLATYTGPIWSALWGTSYEGQFFGSVSEIWTQYGPALVTYSDGQWSRKLSFGMGGMQWVTQSHALSKSYYSFHGRSYINNVSGGYLTSLETVSGLSSTPVDIASMSDEYVYSISGNRLLQSKISANGSLKAVRFIGSSGVRDGQFIYGPYTYNVSARTDKTVSVFDGYRVQIFAPNGFLLKKFQRLIGSLSCQTWLRNGQLVGYDTVYQKLTWFDLQGNELKSVSVGNTFGADLKASQVYRITEDSSGNVWVLCDAPKNVKCLSPDGNLIGEFSSPGNSGLAFDPQGRICTVDGATIYRYSKTGELLQSHKLEGGNLAISKSGYLLTGGGLVTVNTPTGEPLFTLVAENGSDFALDDKSRIIITGSTGTTVFDLVTDNIFDLPFTGKLISKGPGGNLAIYNGDEAVTILGPDGDTSSPITIYSQNTPQSEDGWNRTSIVATLTASDNFGGSGFKELRYTLDTNAQQTSTNANTNVDVSGDGTHTLVFQSVDQAGNVEAAQTKTIKIDSVVPQSSASVNAGRDQVTITATDDRSGVKTIYYAVDGGAEQVYGGPFAITVGPHTITYRAVDKAGNVEASRNLITGIVLSSLELSQASVLGGGNVTATVKLTAPAPAGGAVVNITSANAAATVPQTVNIAAGQSSATFTVATTAVATDTDVKVEASGNDTQASATLKVLAPAPATLTLAPSSVRGGANSTGTVTLNGPAPVGGMTVSLSSNKSDATVPQSVTVAAGETTKTFSVTTSPVVNETAASITAMTAGGSKSATLTLTRAQVSNLTVSPSTITSGATATGTVTIDTQAPTGGTAVSLAVDKSAASVTSTVVIPAGQTSATFTVFTSSVSADTTVFISANANNSSRSSSFTVQPARQVPTSVTLNPTSVLGGAAAQGTVQIGAPAPAGGLSVSLISNNAAATVPGTVLVPAGQTSATFNVATAAVTAPATATITASAGGVSVASNLTVRVLAPTTLVFSPATVTGGASSTATVTVSDPAPAAGTTVLLSSNNVAAKVPVSVKIAAGQTSATFVVTSVAVAADVSASVTSTVGTQSLSNTLIVKAPVAQSVTFLPNSVLGGKASVGIVTLNGITAVGGRVVQLRSSNPAIAAVPASVTVPVGKNVITFNVTTSAVLTSSDVTITATTGAVEASGTLNVRPVVVKTVVMNPLTVVGPASSVGTITLTEAAPVGGVTVTLSSNNASAVVPASISIAAGKTSVTFTTTTKATGTPQVATITAGLNGATSTGTLTVTPVLVSTLTVAPTSVTGGTTATGTVKLVSAPTVDTVVTLTSANTAIVTVPATVTVLKGTTTATFTVTTKKPAAQTAVTLSAVTGGAAKTVSLTVKP